MSTEKKKFILFLDFDGVLTTVRNTLSKGSDRCRLNHYFDQVGIDFLNSLHREHEMTVVVTSTWRKLYGDNTKVMLQSAGFIGNFGNPCITKDLSTHNMMTRGDEILAWLSETNNLDSNIIILDDDSDMSSLLPFLVKTCNFNGITGQNMIDVLDRIDGFK